LWLCYRQSGQTFCSKWSEIWRHRWGGAAIQLVMFVVDIRDIKNGALDLWMCNEVWWKMKLWTLCHLMNIFIWNILYFFTSICFTFSRKIHYAFLSFSWRVYSYLLQLKLLLCTNWMCKSKIIINHIGL
jgi:hypothetical protein